MIRREENERDRQERVGRYKTVWLAVVFLAGLYGAYRYIEVRHAQGLDDFNLNLSTEIFGVVASTGVTLLILDKLNERRDLNNLRRRLTGEAGSRSHDIAISAVEWMQREGWLRGEDGLLKGAKLPGARLQEARLEWTNLEGANLEKAELQKSRLIGANLKDASLKFAKLHNAKLNQAEMQSAKCHDAEMSDARLGSACLEDADLSYACLKGASLQGTCLKGADLRRA